MILGSLSNGRTFEQIRRDWVDQELRCHLGLGFSPKAKHSQYYSVLDTITRYALNHANEINTLSIEDKNWNPKYDSLEDLMERGAQFLRSLVAGLQPDNLTGEAKLNIWQHRSNPISDIENDNSPFLDRPCVESAIGEYLYLTYRSPLLDRMLVDILIALEVYAFTALAVGKKSRHLLNPPWWTGPRVTKKGQTILEKLLTCYAEFNSSGPISVRHLTERLEAASDIGIVWPAPLFALLDDIARRTTRLN